jgi:hypothetical protein
VWRTSHVFVGIAHNNAPKHGCINASMELS